MWRGNRSGLREERVFGYELLFRDGLENAFNGDGDESSQATLDRSRGMGGGVLCDGRRAGNSHIIIWGSIKVEMHLTVAGGENRNAGRICDGAGSGVGTFQGYFG